MADNNRDKWQWPGQNLSRKIITKKFRKAETATIRHTHKFIIKRWDNVREVQTRVMMWIIVMAFLILSTGLQLMWFQSSYLTTAPAKGGTYAEAVLGSVNTLNPLFASTSSEQSASYLMFSSLLRYDKTGHLNNDIATNIKVNNTNTVYTISIRSDVKWHDGFSLTAKDVAFTVGLIKNPNVRATITGWSNISVKVIDNQTIEFNLPAVYAAFEYALTFPILPQHILGSVAAGNIRENNFSQSPIGSGPFKFKFSQDVSAGSDHKIIYMARNNQYYGGTANLVQFQLNTYDTTDEIIHALSSNEVNAAADLSPVDISQVNSRRYTVSVEPVQSGVYAIINTKSPLWSDITLRRALRLATNTQAIRNQLPPGTKSLDLPFTNGQLVGAVPGAPQFDLTAAKQALNSAGWTVGNNNIRQKNGKLLKLSVVTIKGSEFESVLDVLSKQWLAAGISVETQIVNPNDTSQNIVQNILQPRNFDVLLYRLNIGADPDVYAYWASSQATPQGLNFSNYSNVISDDALTSARIRVDPALRNAKYITFAKQWLSDVPAIGLYQSTAQYVYRRNIIAINDSSTLNSAIDRYSNVLDWSIGNRTVYKTP
jgi:peptide/nickel transport system substrate-binding protein